MQSCPPLDLLIERIRMFNEFKFEMLRHSIIASYQICFPVSSSVFLSEQCQQC